MNENEFAKWELISPIIKDLYLVQKLQKDQIKALEKKLLHLEPFIYEGTMIDEAKE